MGRLRRGVGVGSGLLRFGGDRLGPSVGDEGCWWVVGDSGPVRRRGWGMGVGQEKREKGESGVMHVGSGIQAAGDRIDKE